jgi:formate hydrogenlyase subunit 6/NADH:ubiquinone oxidoreductase subunit I
MCHGSIMGITLHTMSERLEKKGAVVVGHYHIYADVCSPFALYPSYTTGHPDEELVKEAAALTPEIIKFIIPPYTINRETCIKCRTCETTCPVNGFDIDADPPRVQDPCIGCSYCVMACPTASLEADWSLMAAHNHEHYPYMKKWLDKAVAQGEFRWRMDPDSIDYDDYMYLQHLRKLKEKKSD